MKTFFFHQNKISSNFADKIESNLLGLTTFDRYNCIKTLNLNLLEFKKPCIVFIDYKSYSNNINYYSELGTKHYFICFGYKLHIKEIIKIKQNNIYAYFDYKDPILEILQMIFELKTGIPYLSINNIITQAIKINSNNINTELLEIIKSSNENLNYKSFYSKLTKTEKDIFNLLSQNESIVEISLFLDLKYNFVFNKCNIIYKKFRVKTKKELLFKIKNIFQIKNRSFASIID